MKTYTRYKINYYINIYILYKIFLVRQRLFIFNGDLNFNYLFCCFINATQCVKGSRVSYKW